MVLNLEVNEYHPDHLSRGAQISIHSPYHVPSPVSEGLFLNMGTVYRIYIRLVSISEKYVNKPGVACRRNSYGVCFSPRYYSGPEQRRYYSKSGPWHGQIGTLSRFSCPKLLLLYYTAVSKIPSWKKSFFFFLIRINLQVML